MIDAKVENAEVWAHHEGEKLGNDVPRSITSQAW